MVNATEASLGRARDKRHRFGKYQVKLLSHPTVRVAVVGLGHKVPG